MRPSRRRIPDKDLFIAPLAEAALILVVGAVGLLTRQPLVFTSLGPTAFELIETPRRRSARPFNIFFGHLIGVVCGFLALFLTHAFAVPPVSDHGPILVPRLAAAAIAVLLTVLFTLLLRTMQPAALSTTLLVALGPMQRGRDVLVILGAVLLMILIGEPLRRWRLRSSPSFTESDFDDTP